MLHQVSTGTANFCLRPSPFRCEPLLVTRIPECERGHEESRTASHRRARRVAGRSPRHPSPAVLPGTAARTQHTPSARRARPRTWPALRCSPARRLHSPRPAPARSACARGRGPPRPPPSAPPQPPGLGGGEGRGLEARPPPRGSRGRPVTPPRPSPRGTAATLPSPAGTPSLLAGETPGHLALPAPPSHTGRAPRALAARGPPGPPLAQTSHPGRPRRQWLTRLPAGRASPRPPPPSLGSGCHGFPVSQKPRQRPER